MSEFVVQKAGTYAEHRREDHQREHNAHPNVGDESVIGATFDAEIAGAGKAGQTIHHIVIHTITAVHNVRQRIIITDYRRPHRASVLPKQGVIIGPN
jgi:hypothetical protein